MASAERSSIAHQNHHHQQQQQQQQQQQVLKCPRCNSSNTKFCYYNNYSLSQPRHLCKACKRYWTRGGTLRNVPVGGGCRKNKRIKRQLSTVDYSPKPNLDQSTPSIDTNLNPLYGLLQQNPKYPRFSTRVSDNISDHTDHISRFDLVQSDQMSSLELGFSSSDPHNSASLVSSYPSMFSNGDHTMGSLLSSNLQQQPTFLGFAEYGNDQGGPVVHDVERGIQKGSTDWNNSFNGTQNDENDQIKALESSDPASFLWAITGGDGGEWHDPTSNLSVPSLI